MPRVIMDEISPKNYFGGVSHKHIEELLRNK